ncbi:MAG: exodeoxyribonuclease 7 large subunit [Pirellulaceae bacterium]|nr:MAG: exodeoxyribonuclease 7 large subunit [Pirellulaceae bacterium]GIW93782.1 MAG: exodeoxyribonuclease 7 large subunit [Pirellulaceae bacterium]
MATAEHLDDLPTADQPWTVSQLTTQIKWLLESTFVNVWVCGEVSDLARPQSGHLYFALKDERAQIRAVVWRSYAAKIGFDLEDGQQVVCCGRLDVYPPRGSYQLVVTRVVPLGEGAWQIRLRQLREKLAREGLFDPAHKKPLPRFPRCIGLITSPSGAALHDFLETLRKRWQAVRVLLFPVRVQGDGAAEEVIQAVKAAHRLASPPDVLVITRGGGSVEDLWCFNEESLVRAVSHSQIPVVSAIGHDIDVTLCDLVADVRALTPTEAAQKVVPSHEEFRAWLDQTGRRLVRAIRERLERARQRLEHWASRPVLSRPEDLIHSFEQRVDDVAQRLQSSMRLSLERARRLLDGRGAQLQALSPLATLARGYSVTLRDDGSLVRQSSDVATGDTIETILARGRIRSRVEDTREDLLN